MMMMRNQMVMMVELGRVIILMVPRAQLEDMAQGREHEEQELEEHLFRCRDSEDDGKNEDKLQGNEFDHQDDGQRCHYELLFDVFFWNREKNMLSDVFFNNKKIRKY